MTVLKSWEHDIGLYTSKFESVMFEQISEKLKINLQERCPIYKLQEFDYFKDLRFFLMFQSVLSALMLFQYLRSSLQEGGFCVSFAMQIFSFTTICVPN